MSFWLINPVFRVSPESVSPYFSCEILVWHREGEHQMKSLAYVPDRLGFSIPVQHLSGQPSGQPDEPSFIRIKALVQIKCAVSEVIIVCDFTIFPMPRLSQPH